MTLWQWWAEHLYSNRIFIDSHQVYSWTHKKTANNLVVQCKRVPWIIIMDSRIIMLYVKDPDYWQGKSKISENLFFSFTIYYFYHLSMPVPTSIMCFLGSITGNTWSAWSTVTLWTPLPSTAPANYCWHARGTRWKRCTVMGRTASSTTADCWKWVGGETVHYGAAPK